jgi:hypothetical protein
MEGVDGAMGDAIDGDFSPDDIVCMFMEKNAFMEKNGSKKRPPPTTNFERARAHVPVLSLQFFSRFGVKGHESGQPQAFGCMQVSCSIENRGENLGFRNGSSGGWSTFDKERENDKIVGRGHPMWG